MAEEQTNQTEQTTQTTATSSPNQSLANTTQQTEQTKQEDISLANQKDEKVEVNGAPEKYEPWKVPEGFELTEEATKEVGDLFKKHGLSQEASQELVDHYIKEVQKIANGPLEYWQQMQQDWRKEITNDPKYGDGNGKLKPDVAKAIADVKNLMPPDLKKGFEEAMDLTGAGNAPAFIKGIHFLASKLTEGSHVAGRGPSTHGQQKPGSPSGPGAAALWPSLPSAQGS